MPKFKITIEKDVWVEARNGREAARKVFHLQNRLPVAVNGRYIKDHCENCDLPIFGDESHQKDDDGTPLCNKCARKI